MTATILIHPSARPMPAKASKKAPGHTGQQPLIPCRHAGLSDWQWANLGERPVVRAGGSMILFRAFASHPAQAPEVMVFFQCHITEQPAEAILARLALIWGVTPKSIDAYNVWSEGELRQQAMGPMEAIAYDSRLFEVGCCNGAISYEYSLPLFLVCPEMQDRLYTIWQKLPRQQQVAA